MRLGRLARNLPLCWKPCPLLLLRFPPPSLLLSNSPYQVPLRPPPPQTWHLFLVGLPFLSPFHVTAFIVVAHFFDLTGLVNSVISSLPLALRKQTSRAGT